MTRRIYETLKRYTAICIMSRERAANINGEDVFAVANLHVAPQDSHSISLSRGTCNPISHAIK